MIRSRKLILICIVLAMFVAAGVNAFAQSKEEITSSMRDRYPALLDAKNKGLVGESWTGLVALVDSNAPAAVQNLVNAENNDRRALFQAIAQETGTSVEEVARQNRIRMYRLAEDNHFLQDQSRQWVKKGDAGL
ncbi:MAG: DUF1318 domain-containing protein [Desulfonatronovibrio sp. MSAO_Bac4]|nr:MAG: DUF1318 domain-containing protein [Desulfonatronovibrio sp. MSAO_Bac4]